MKFKNNPSDLSAYIEFKKKQEQRAKATQLEAEKMKIRSNLEAWNNAVPLSLKNAKPSSLGKSILEKLKNSNLTLKEPFEKRVLITSRNPEVSKFVAFSIIYGLIQSGIVTPSQIRRTRLLEGYNNINGMFQSRNWKDTFFDPKAKVLLIEGASKNLTSLASKGEEQFWKELDDFIKNKDKLIILTYDKNEEEMREVEGVINVPEITVDKDLNMQIIRKSGFIKITTEEEEYLKNEQRKTY